MKQRVQLKRVLLLLGLLGLAFAGLGYRLVDLQVLRHDELAKLAQDNTQREFWQAPRRGDILDAHGNLLATSVPVKTVCANPSLLGNQQAVVARALAPLLQIDESALRLKLFPRPGKNSRGEIVTNNLHYVRLQRNVSDDTWEKIQFAMSNLSFGVDEKEAVPIQPRVLPQLAPIRDLRRAGPDARLSKRRAGGAGAGLFER